MITQLAAAGYSLSQDQIAARLPRGYDPAGLPALSDSLRLKSFTIARPLSLAEISRPALIETVADFASAGLPLLQFGWSALQNAAPTRV